MTEEEKKAISIVENIKFKKYKIYIAKEMKDEIRFYQTEEERKAIDIVLNLIERLQKENEEMKKDLNNIIDLMHFNVISKQGEVYKPIKNLRKLDVYEIYYKIQETLGTNRIYRKYRERNGD